MQKKMVHLAVGGAWKEVEPGRQWEIVMMMELLRIENGIGIEIGIGRAGRGEAVDSIEVQKWYCTYHRAAYSNYDFDFEKLCSAFCFYHNE